MHPTDEKLVSVLRQRGLKVTPQRLAIFRYLAHNESHPSAEKIYSDIKGELPTISQGTVYKTLSMLAELGIIRELKLGNGHSRYDSNTSVHVNLICPVCDDIIDYQSTKITRFWDAIVDDIGGQITGQRFDVYKICDDCNRSERKLNSSDS